MRLNTGNRASVEGTGQRTTEKLVQFLEEYGTKRLASTDSDGNPNSSLVTNLTYTQALILIRKKSLP
ncbi:DUF3102 domain-containing protein [Desulfosporosinus youngiae]|uniref:DUF3102 domain-containing protein n=1 Tax=Desulfosporosinus youngiae TaxID=339862 RepID=UPI000A073C32